MIPMSCNIHDAYAAGSQFITHFTGRVLGQLGISTTPINTKGYESLLSLRDNTIADSLDLFIALYKYNKSAESFLNQFEDAVKTVRKSLTCKDGQDKDNVLADRILNSAPSGTSHIARKVAELREAGKKVIGLNVGEPYVATPDFYCKWCNKST
eukprot:UN30710